MPSPSTVPPRQPGKFAHLVQDMLQVAAQQALPPAASRLTFVPVSSFYYSDGAGMMTLTGIVCDDARADVVERAFGDWDFANLKWNPPKVIDVPVLSTRERLHIQHLLPSHSHPGKTLREAMGYLIGDNVSKTECALEQYAAFHRYSPYVLRGMP